MARKGQILGRAKSGLTENTTSPSSNITSLKHSRFPHIQGSTYSSPSYRGKTKPQHTSFNFESLPDCPFLQTNHDKIYDHLLRGRAQSTLKNYLKWLSVVARFLEWLRVAHRINVEQVAQLTPAVNILYLAFLQQERQPHAKMSFFRRFLLAVGVPEEDVPPNPYEQSEPAPKTTNTIPETKAMLKHFVGEIKLVRDRRKEMTLVREAGRNPCRNSGGKFGDWGDLANRLFVTEKIIGLHCIKWQEIRDSGLRTELAGLERHDGAISFGADRVPKRRKGLEGHLNYFHPFQRDMLPFLVTLLIRTNFPVSSLMGLRLGEFSFRILSVMSGDLAVTQCSVTKTRTVNDPDQEPTIIHSLSIETHWSHTRSLLRFLEELTSDLRLEILRQIESLESHPLDGQNVRKLEHLRKIKDDIFIYRHRDQIFSLGAYAEVGNTPHMYGMALKALGFPTDLSRIKSSGLVKGLSFLSDDSIVIAMLSSHLNLKTPKHYENRSAIRRKDDALFNEIFDKTVSLVCNYSFSKENLRDVLSDQGFDENEAAALETRKFVTSWGNCCSNPYAPPQNFAMGTPAGKPCVGQRCIDGCPNARWFSDAKSIVEQKIQDLERRLDSTAFILTHGSIIHARLSRLKRLLDFFKSGAKGDG